MEEQKTQWIDEIYGAVSLREGTYPAQNIQYLNCVFLIYPYLIRDMEWGIRINVEYDHTNASGEASLSSWGNYPAELSGKVSVDGVLAQETGISYPRFLRLKLLASEKRPYDAGLFLIREIFGEEMLQEIQKIITSHKKEKKGE